MFVELGSDESQWRDATAARAVAAAVLESSGVAPDRTRQVVGFGGGHYAPRFERIVRETDWAVGHVAADWALEAMGSPEANRDVVERAFAASTADYAVVDGDRAALRDVIGSLGHRVVSETWLRETDGVDLALVEALEAELTTVDDGLRFGAAAVDHEGGFEAVEMPDSLLAAAAGVDAAAAREAVAAETLAFETSEGGTRPSGRAAVAGAGAVDAVVDALAGVLEAKYETVERTDAEVVARSVGFDPEKARERGVPEGPAFGRLAAGEAVEVDGERVAPEDVSGERIERFDI